MTVFFCENNLNGFYTAVYYAYYSKRKPDIITSATEYQPTFTTEIIKIETDESLAIKVKNAVVKYTGFTSELKNIEIALLHSSQLKETICYNYLKLIFEKRSRVDLMLSEMAVIEFNDLKKQVLLERHRFTGMLRFLETESGALYAHYEPDHDITKILSTHFIARYKGLPFIIHDVKRNFLCLYDGLKPKYFSPEVKLNIYLSNDEENMQNLWKNYFNSVNIVERPHKKQQDNFLPRRYRKNMTEFL